MATPSPSSMSQAAAPAQYRAIGIVLAVSSGLLIGSSFVFKKKGLLASQAHGVAGEGVAYLKNPLWWTGMTMMILGELCNFGAYAFVEAILVTPLGALSVCICAILSHFFLKEKLTLFGWIGCIQCILGSIIIAMNGPEEQSVSTIDGFKTFFLAPWFLVYGGLVIAAALTIIIFVAPKYGKKSMLWYIMVCSLFGGLSVSCTQGLGASILTTIRGQNQFKNWFIYFLLVFVVCTLLTELYYLNVALALFNTAMVTPTYYVLFTFCTLVTSVILYEGLKASAVQILTVVFGFLVICTGIFVLQMSKVDPRKLRVDRRTSILLRAAREEVAPLVDAPEGEFEHDPEKALELSEEPGMDALRGTFGAIGSIVRARRRATIISQEPYRSRRNTDTSNGSARPSSEDHANGGVPKARRQMRELRDGRNGRPAAVFQDSISTAGSHISPEAEEPTMSRLLAATSHPELYSSPASTPRAGLRSGLPSPSSQSTGATVRFIDSHPQRISEGDEKEAGDETPREGGANVRRAISTPSGGASTIRPSQQRATTDPSSAQAPLVSVHVEEPTLPGNGKEES